MNVLGLTGGVGMGKSTAAHMLRTHGVQVVDTDDLARRLVEPGQSALAEIKEVFGDEVISSDGGLNRGELARIVFADIAARRKIEAILHPRIRQSWLAQVELWRRGDCRLAAVVIPLLFETQAASQFDKVICVACSAANQQQRLSGRGWTATQIRQRIAAQMPVEQKINRADFIVWTDGDLVAHAQQIERILSKI
jgi:dephospho-CoA kinase